MTAARVALSGLVATLIAGMPAVPGSAQSEDAGAEFRRCAVLFGTERFEEAAQCFDRAYALGRDPSMLYNLARARERAGQSEGAIEAYRGYLAARPDAPERVEVEASLAALEAARPPTDVVTGDGPAGDDTGAVPMQEPIVAPVQQVEGPDLLGPALVGGLGFAGIGVALALSIQAQAAHGAAVAEPIQLRAQSLASDASGLALGANIAWVTAGVLAGVGLVWGLVEIVESSSTDDTPAPRARVAIGPASIQLHLEL